MRKSGNSPRRLFVLPYNNYYHFLTESAMGLYRELKRLGQLRRKNCEIWHNGQYPDIIQLFSQYPPRVIQHWGEIPPDARILPSLRPKNQMQWTEVLPLKNYLKSQFVQKAETPGITIIKRCHNRCLTNHGDLVKLLKQSGFPVREAAMETLSFKDQINLMHNTFLLIAPHGSGTVNMIFMPRGSAVLELYPKGFYNNVYRDMSPIFDLAYFDLESGSPSVLGRAPSPRVRDFIKQHGWPNREDYRNWKPDRMELGRVLRDVSQFSIDIPIVAWCVEIILRHYSSHLAPPN